MMNTYDAAHWSSDPSYYSSSSDFLMGRSQVERLGSSTSAMLILTTGNRQACELSPLLYSLFTQDCKARCDSNTIIKFANDTTW